MTTGKCQPSSLVTLLTSSIIISQYSPVLFVDLITKAYSINNRQFEVDVAFLQVISSRPQIHAVLIMACLFVLKHGVEKCVH